MKKGLLNKVGSSLNFYSDEQWGYQYSVIIEGGKLNVILFTFLKINIRSIFIDHEPDTSRCMSTIFYSKSFALSLLVLYL